jgi:hypothetical protein
MPKKSWRCFHCDELFTSAAKARVHFGYDNHSTPACFIVGAAGSLIEKLREAEKDLDDAWFAIQEETLDCHKAMRAQSARHQSSLVAAEELGYERGLRDGRAEASKPPHSKCGICEGIHDNDALTDICTSCETRINDEGSP